jgi:Domain of unknown function (DUF4190)
MSTTFCTNCGSEASSGAFCTNCGTATGSGASQSTPSGTGAAYQQLNQPKPQPTQTNVLAIIALVTSLVGIHLAGIICGHIALNQIKTSGENGRGMALAGLIIGYVFLALVIVLCSVWFIFFFAAINAQYA